MPLRYFTQKAKVFFMLVLFDCSKDLKQTNCTYTSEKGERFTDYVPAREIRAILSRGT
nr:MAG TPA: hypothetical protein [Crassvirales sp.]